VERALEENQTLLREITHRTKNDLELLRSMLSLQAATVTDARAGAALETAMERVSVMGRMYRIFHESGADAPTSPCRILEDLADYWREALFSADESLSLQCEERTLPEQVVVSIGIIANEIVTNTAKYARGGADALSVDITVTFPERGVLKLTVADSGPGFPPRILDGSDRGRGLGLTMANSLAEQYGGSLILNNASGDVRTTGGAAATVILRGEWE
jgi:two-component sensor histidine kinase